MATAPAATDASPDFVAALNAARNPDGGFGYYAGKRSRIEPTAWVALTPSSEAARAVTWLAEAQGDDGWVRDDRRAPINYAFNALALLAFLTDPHTWVRAERLGQALLQVKGLSYPPSPVVRQDNSLQAWSWVDGTLSWVEPTAWSLIAVKRALALGLLSSSASTARVRIDVGERLLQDRACVSGGWNYGNAQVFGTNLIAHGPTTALALLAMHDRPALPFVQAGLAFLAAQADRERSGQALALTSICLRRFGRAADPIDHLARIQAPTSLRLANTVTVALLAVALADDAGALVPLTLTA